MNDDKQLLDAAYIKLRNNEPMSGNDMKRLINLIVSATWQLEPMSQEIEAGLQSQMIAALQQRFMQGQQPQ